MQKNLNNFSEKNFSNSIKILSQNAYKNKTNFNTIYKDVVGQSNKLKRIIEKRNFKIIRFKGSDESLKDQIVLLAKLLGKPVSQNKKKEKFVTIKPNIKLLNKYKNISSNKIRYHQTNKGGSIHTDGPQLERSPKILVMGCIKNAKKGGDTILVNAKKLFKKIKNFDKSSSEILREKFYFERRGFYGKKILSKKIFNIKKNNFEFRYLREYIDTAYKLKNFEIPSKKKRALDILDKFLMKKNLQLRLKLKAGDVIIINNKLIAHGRTSFTLSKIEQRKLLRIWIN